MKNREALHAYLKPLAAFLHDPHVSEVSINRPGEVCVERGNDTTAHPIPSLTAYWLEGLATLMGQFSDQRVGRHAPLLSATLPDGHRLQCILPPASEVPILSIRKSVTPHFSLEDYAAQGAFADVVHTPPLWTVPQSTSPDDAHLKKLLAQRQYVPFLKTAIRLKKNMLISGPTSTGKTTFLNACLAEVPLEERIITLEDVREIHLPHRNTVHLLASKGDQGVGQVTLSQLIEAALRLRPDRIVLGELRGAEAADFINATATGHNGALSTLHASSPDMAFLRLVHMVKLKPGLGLTRRDILHDLHSLVDIVVQLTRVDTGGQYQRRVSALYWANGA